MAQDIRFRLGLRVQHKVTGRLGRIGPFAVSRYPSESGFAYVNWDDPLAHHSSFVSRHDLRIIREKKKKP